MSRHTSFYPDLSKVSPLDLAYIAGLVDGEGHVTLQVTRSGAYVRMEIANTHKKTLEWVQGQIGGPINEKRRYSSKHKRSYAIRLCGVGAYHALKAIRPHLKIKAAVADSVLHYYDTYGTKLVPVEATSVKLLHRRGPLQQEGAI